MLILLTLLVIYQDVGRKAADLSKSANTQWSPVRLAALKDVNIRAFNTGCCSPFVMAITEEGEVYAWGRNEKGQLGLGDIRDRKVSSLRVLWVGFPNPSL